MHTNEEEFKRRKQTLYVTLLEFDKVLSNINSIANNNGFRDKRVGVFYHSLKMYYCIEDLITLSENKGSVQSLVTLNRMIVDNYAVLYLLTSHSTPEEQLLRYYLYLFDALKTRSKSLSDFFESCSVLPPESIYNNVMSALEQDSKDMIQIIEMLKKDGIYDMVDPITIEKLNWKFKEHFPKKKRYKNQYSWSELYQVARIPENFSKLIQNYHSQYVHGLGISLMQKPNDDCISIVTSIFDTTNAIIWNTLTILLNTYSDIIKEDLLHENTVRVMKAFWNDSFNER
jgi:hypothetical protein